VRPIALTIEGLTSYRQRQEIDFTDLDLFVITGPTGAGKSSILDAMTLALYGSVARVNGHELKELISHGQSHMRVQFDFAVGGDQYRVARVFSRTRPQNISFEQFEGESLSPVLDKGAVKDINQKIEELVGLDFSAFTKAVLLPQGDFAAFLKGEAAERRKTLVRLLDLDRYERAGQLARRHVVHLDAVLGERAALIESDYADATSERKAVLDKLVDAAKDRHAVVGAAKEKAATVADEAAKTTATIERVEAAVAQLGDAHERLERLAGQWTELAVRTKTATEAREAAEAAFQTDAGALSDARKALAQTVEKNGNAALLASLAAADQASRQEERTLDKLLGQLSDAETTERLTAQESADSAARETAAADELQRIREELVTANQRLDHSALAVECVERTADVARIDGERVQADKQVSDAELKAAMARSKMEHLRAEHVAAGLRVGLQLGDRCPVCDVVIEALPPSDEGVEHLFDEARRELESCEVMERLANDTAVSLGAERKRAAAELSRVQAQLPKGFEVPVDLKKARVDHKAAQQDVKSKQGAERAAATAARAATSQVTEARARASAASTALAAVKEAILQAKDRRAAAVEVLQATLGKRLPPNVSDEIARRSATLSEAESALKATQIAADRSRDVRDGAELELTAAREAVGHYGTELATVRTSASVSCNALAAELGNDGIPELPGEHDDYGLLTSAWQNCCDGFLKTADKRLRSLRAAVEKLKARIAKLATDTRIDLADNQAAASLAVFDHALIEAHGAVVAAEKDLSAHLLKMEARERLEQSIASEREERALYGQLADELRANRFIGFVLEESMNHLADQASIELLRISDGRYSLAAEEGDFDVIDHTNADERRSVATLSGGETFLASLSLALALSVGLRDFARTAAARLDAIFIDEGFGALDPDTLDVVVDALERLRDGDRMVGVITHVPTLAERIPAGLRVEGRGGSSRISIRV
jgi:DNA repair protein SbcC/Rad50